MPYKGQGMKKPKTHDQMSKPLSRVIKKEKKIRMLRSVTGGF